MKYEHGTLSAYHLGGCRCDPCRRNMTRRQKIRRLLIDRGEWNPYVSVVGSRRRILSLATMGWTLLHVASEVGVQPENLRNAIRLNHQIRSETAAAIASVFDRLGDKPAPTDSISQRISVARAKSWAAKNGGLPPIAWDEDSIDNPDAMPYAEEHSPIDPVAIERAMTGRPVPLNRWEKTEAIHRLHRQGLSDAKVGAVLGMTGDAVCAQRIRHPEDEQWAS